MADKLQTIDPKVAAYNLERLTKEGLEGKGILAKSVYRAYKAGIGNAGEAAEITEGVVGTDAKKEAKDYVSGQWLAQQKKALANHLDTSIDINKNKKDIENGIGVGARSGGGPLDRMAAVIQSFLSGIISFVMKLCLVAFDAYTTKDPALAGKGFLEKFKTTWNETTKQEGLANFAALPDINVDKDALYAELSKPIPVNAPATPAPAAAVEKSITVADFTKLFTSEKVGEMLDKGLATVDKNGDGTITKDEFSIVGDSPKKVTEFKQELQQTMAEALKEPKAREQIAAIMDQNKDGRITESEVRTVMGQLNSPTGQAALIKQLNERS